MIEGKIGPRERFEIGTRRRHRRPLHGDIFEYLRAVGLAFFIELFRGCLQSLEDRLGPGVSLGSLVASSQLPSA